MLSPYRVIDLTDPLGFLAGKVLADLGADVIKVEPPGGDPSRRWLPRVQARDGADGTSVSAVWLAGNANKRSVTLALESPADRTMLDALVDSADFLIESYPPGWLTAHGLGAHRLREINPRLIVVSITPFGQHGPYRDFRGSDLEIMALGGAMSLAGEADQPPVRVTVAQAPSWAGVEAAMGALTALSHRTLTGRGQHVDVSAQAAVMSALAHAPVFWDLNGVNPKRAGIFVTGRSVTGARMRVFWPCRDGWINFILYGGVAGRHTNQQLVAWMNECDMAPDDLIAIDWSTVQVPTLTQDAIDRLEEPIGRFFRTITKRQFYEGAVRRQMLGYPVATVADIYADPHLQARGFWQPIADPATGRTLQYPGGFAIVDGERLALRRPAPRPGEHNEEILRLVAATEKR